MRAEEGHGLSSGLESGRGSSDSRFGSVTALYSVSRAFLICRGLFSLVFFNWFSARLFDEVPATSSRVPLPGLRPALMSVTIPHTIYGVVPF